MEKEQKQRFSWIVLYLLDAKYRDLWERNLPREMLYQLAIYAVSGIGDKTSTILYPVMSDEPKIQKIDIRNPISPDSLKGEVLANVVLQPINLRKVAEWVSKYADDELANYVDSILNL